MNALRHVRLVLSTLLVLIVSQWAFESQAQGPVAGILGRQAPEWNIETWYNLPAGEAALEITDLRGKVIYLFGFQSWCPGCHAHGFPTLQATHERFADEEDVVFVAVQTVFEGLGVNTAAAAKKACDQFELDIPCGHDPGTDGTRSNILSRYRTGGTPWTILIDRQGTVRFNGFSIRPEQAIQAVQRLLQETSPDPNE